MTINKFRSFLYRLAKGLGDVQAVSKAARTGSVKPVTDRVIRRAAGRITGQALGSAFRALLK